MARSPLIKLVRNVARYVANGLPRKCVPKPVKMTKERVKAPKPAKPMPVEGTVVRHCRFEIDGKACTLEEGHEQFGLPHVDAFGYAFVGK